MQLRANVGEGVVTGLKGWLRVEGVRRIKEGGRVKNLRG